MLLIQLISPEEASKNQEPLQIFKKKRNPEQKRNTSKMVAG